MSRALVLSLLSLPALALASPPVVGGASGSSGPERPDATPLPAQDEGADATIINGVAATIDDYPETGMLLFDGDIVFGGSAIPTRTAVCSSTLIAPDVVLLAAHCVDPDAFTFGFGSLDNEAWYWSRQEDLSSLNGENPEAALPADAIAVSDLALHPDWDMQALQTGVAQNDDIALIFLEEPVLDVEHAYLPTEEEVEQIAEGMDVHVVGWGQQVATAPFDPVPPGTVYIKRQGPSHISKLGDFEFKVGELETDTRKCHGDSGGPSFMELEDQDQPVTRRLIGVTSHAYDEETNCFETGGVDTRVDAYIAWIDQEMRARCEDGTRSWCPNREDDFGVLPPPGEGGAACGCTTSPAPGLAGVWALGLLALAARRRRA